MPRPEGTRTYDVYFLSNKKIQDMWQIYATDAFHARCVVEEMNPACHIKRVLLNQESEW